MAKLTNNVVRINGYKAGKRTHVDVEVPMCMFRFGNPDKEITVTAPTLTYDFAQLGFDKGLEGVTSYNAWNWVSKKRLTTKLA